MNGKRRAKVEGVPRSAAPNTLLGIERREHDRLVVDFAGVLVHGAGGLSAKVAIFGFEVERGHAVRAARAGKLHAAGDPLSGVVSHWGDCNPLVRTRGCTTVWLSKVTCGSVAEGRLLRSLERRGVRPHTCRRATRASTFPGGCIFLILRADGRAGARLLRGHRCLSWFRRPP